MGVTESGFIPGGLWTLSTWYTKKETAKRVMIFYFGNQFGQASAKLLGFTCFSGFILGFFLPDSFKRPHSTFLPKVKIFTDRELHILNSRILLDDPMKGRKKKSIGLAAFKKLVRLPRISCPCGVVSLMMA